MTSPVSPSGPWISSVSGRFSEASSGSRKRTSEPSIGPCCGGRVEHRDLFFGFDFAAEREGVEAFAGERLEDLVVGVRDRERVGQRLRLFALVLDFEEDAEVGRFRRRRRLADQVGGVLVVVRVEVAREDDVVVELAELDRLALDDVLLVARVAAGGDGDGEGRQGEGGEQRQDESAAGWTSAAGVY